MSGKPLTAAIVGAGHRSVLYASLSKSQPEKLQVVAVAEPDDTRRNKTAADYGLAPESCFLTAEEMAAQPALADVASKVSIRITPHQAGCLNPRT